ncbi:MAG: hypothetical protein ACR2M1_11530 [Gemmatimonadaceae bacterium]
MAPPLAALPLALLLLAACDRSPSSGRDRSSVVNVPMVAMRTGPNCGVTNASVVTGDGIGALRIGRSVSDIGRDCTVVSDTTRIGRTGAPVRVLTVDLGFAPGEAEIAGDTVRRIVLDAPAFRTADSLGFGTPIARLRPLDGFTLARGDGRIFALDAAHCGINFRLSYGAEQIPPLTKTLELRNPDPRLTLPFYPAYVDLLILTGNHGCTGKS